MRTSEIRFTITLDDNNVPEQIHWRAADAPGGGQQETPAIALALWDQHDKSTMKIDLWTKEMPVGEMKRFLIGTIGSLADTLENATDDMSMAGDIRELCERLSKKLADQEKTQE
ncbi:gliding motility-associated protein GldC [Catalinimonas alkaloidigena]|uniref:Gliding motility-associated protein GldC n=1 Tax=Catalinimonas alkaloidigena TaxID=1075417 RepID=A0A1G9GQG4_9BACT|nr:gliding motility protein GldC [Catalinimonas alkaloidigena]SDL02917.1 gliding motility-associated protein GldC [Catalinimonas alkaloidigena]